MSELVEGFEFVSGLNNNITILGSKSISSENPYYAAAEELGTWLAEQSYSFVTGGSTGFAEATNMGAFHAGGASIGVAMHGLSQKRSINPFLI